ncbi:MAG: tetratricopeptide repeat protein [Phycisphaerales bacterium]
MANVRVIFTEAFERTGADRDDFVRQACGGDAELRQRVERLLAAADRDDDFLANPTQDSAPAATQAAAPMREGPGTRIGPYKLLQLIGEGGFGSVFMAEQEKPVVRRVALKIIKLGMDTRQVVARFEQERQALAIMDHPNIARVLDAGATEAGRPYFVMELCSGVPITAYCDRENLGIRERLELFVQVCLAVQHAHQKGVIHRDIKPTNVLVSTHDGRPFAKVIDFGIAKATGARMTEKTIFTEHRALIGTPEYMSPEQAEGSVDIDTRSDVYSLGVLLYELLTGNTPFDARRLRSAAFGEIQRIIREVEPPKPSTRLASLLLPTGKSGSADAGDPASSLAVVAAHRRVEPRKLGALIRGDLDWVVMKALEKDRRRRYETASNLAADVQRHLANEAVVAAPPTAGYRLRKAVRRNKRAVVLAGTIAGALLAGSALATLGLIRATVNERHTRREASRADAVSEFLQEMLTSADPALAEGRGLSIGFVLGEAVKRIDGGAFADQPETEALLRETIGRTYTTLQLFVAAEAQLAMAVTIRTRVLGPEHPDTLGAIHHWCIAVFYWNDRFGELEPVVRRNFEARTRVLGEKHPDTLDSMDKLTWALFSQGKFAEAEPISRRVLELRERVHGPLHTETITSLNYMGNMLAMAGRLAEAEVFYRDSLERSIRARGAESRETAESHSCLAQNLQQQGRAAEAEPFALRAVEVSRKAGPAWKVADHLIGLARVTGDLGRHEDSSRMLEEAIEIKRRLRGLEDGDTLCCMHIAGKVYRDHGNLDRAEAIFREVVEVRRRVRQPDQIIWTLAAMWDLAGLYESQRRYDLAEPLLVGAHEEAGAEPRTALAEKRTAVERLAGLYEAWDRAEPGRGYDAKRVHWQELLKGETP